MLVEDRGEVEAAGEHLREIARSADDAGYRYFSDAARRQLDGLAEPPTS